MDRRHARLCVLLVILQLAVADQNFKWEELKMGAHEEGPVVPGCGVETAFTQDMVVAIMLELNAMGKLGHSVEWSDSLARKAQEKANTCCDDLDEDPVDCDGNSVEQGIISITDPDFCIEDSPFEVIYNMKYAHSSKQRLESETFCTSSPCSRMYDGKRRGTRHVGCGYRACTPDDVVAVCISR